jgi:hypothetical protein
MRTFLVSVHGRWPKVIARAGDRALLQKQGEAQKRFRTQGRGLGDRDMGGGRLQHPDRDLQSFAHGVNDGNGSVASLGPTKDA